MSKIINREIEIIGGVVMIKFFNILIVTLILSFAFDANADATSSVICKIVGYTHSIGGPMITIVIIGAALLSIFGRMPWPALFALGAFTAVFFGAPAVVSKITPSGSLGCDSAELKCIAENKTWTPGTGGTAGTCA